MKHFLYLDTDISASIVAQSEKGYITQMMKESGTENSSDEQKSIGNHASVGGGAKLFSFFRQVRIWLPIIKDYMMKT